MMQPILQDSNLVAPCGLYCGACRSFRKGKCPGCAKNIKAIWCKIRTCTHARGYRSCAECKDCEDPMQCPKFNNPIAKIFALVFRSDRAACINQIKRLGIDGHARNMAESGRQSIKR